MCVSKRASRAHYLPYYGVHSCRGTTTLSQTEKEDETNKQVLNEEALDEVAESLNQAVDSAIALKPIKQWPSRAGLIAFATSR